jgi:uncharacterized protein YukE
MCDLLADPRAADLLAAVPDEVARAAAQFRSAAGESKMTAAGLSAARHDGTWTGRAADAFRRAIGRLPSELDQIRAGFSAVAEALTTYESELAAIRPAFSKALAELAVLPNKGNGFEAAMLRRRAFELLEEFSAARAACQDAIAAAQGIAPRPEMANAFAVVEAAATVR